MRKPWAASLLTFHDSIELFLQISVEQLNTSKNEVTFMGYWDLLSKKLSITVFPQKESMRRLNKARVALKHNGTLPSKLDVEAFRATSNLFFEEATKLIFNMEFSQISLIEYVSPEEARKHLKEAERLCLTSDFEDATTEIAFAFDKMISSYEENKHEWGRGSPFFFGEDLTFLSSFHMGIDKHGHNDLGDFVDKVKDSVEAMQRAIKILALGLDYRKYSKFKRLLPHISRTLSGKYIVQKGRLGKQEPADKEYIEFCINFIVESAIKLNEFDYEIKTSLQSNPLDRKKRHFFCKKMQKNRPFLRQVIWALGKLTIAPYKVQLFYE
jgi:hypothetical protein